MKPVLIVGVLALMASDGRAQPDAAPPGPSKVAAVEGLGALSMDELIARLPPAGTEWRWDRKSQKGVEDPAANELGRRIAKENLSDEQWRTALLRTGALRFRDRWPKDTDYAVSMTVPRWLGVSQIRLRPRAEGMRSAAAGELVRGFSGTIPAMMARDARLGQAMGRVPPDTREIVFDVDVERGERSAFVFRDKEEARPKPGMLWTGTITRSIEIVDTLEQALPPASNKDLDLAVRDAIGAGMRTWGQDARPVPFVLIDPDCAKYPALATTGLDLKAEVVKDGNVLAETSLIAMDADTLMLGSSVSSAAKRYYGSANFKIEGDEPDTSGWTLRLTGRADHVWLLWDAKERWSGTITIPWNEAVRHEAERAGSDGRGPEASTPYMR